MKHTGIRSTLAALMLLLVFPLAASAQLMIIGNDEKFIWDDAGVVRFFSPGKDTVSIVDISDPESPKIIANLRLENSIIGPPTNLAITPDGKYLYVGNFSDQDVSILKVNGTNVTDTGKRLQLPGHPASMRGRVR